MIHNEIKVGELVAWIICFVLTILHPEALQESIWYLAVVGCAILWPFYVLYKIFTKGS